MAAALQSQQVVRCIAEHFDAPVDDTTGEGLRILHLLLPELPLKTAVKLAAEISGESKNTLYDLALALKKSS